MYTSTVYTYVRTYMQRMVLTLYMHNIFTYVCMMCSRDAQIRQLELELAAAPKQDRVERYGHMYVCKCVTPFTFVCTCVFTCVRTYVCY